MHANSRAFVVHRTPTRIRIKIPERQRQEGYFAALKRALTQPPDVVGVHINPLAASVVIVCRDGFELLGQNHRFPGLELLAGEPCFPKNNRPAPFAHGHDGSELNPADTIGFLELIIKLIVALATRQLGAQLIEWVVAAVVQAAWHEAAGITARRQALEAPPILLLSPAE